MNLSELRAYVRDLTGFQLSTLVSDARVNRAVNETLYHLAGLEDWTWLRTASDYTGVTGQTTYGLTGFSQVARVVVRTGTGTHDFVELERLGAQDPRLITSEDAEPRYYAVTGGSTPEIQVWPAGRLGGREIVVYGKVSPVSLAADVDAPTFRPEHHSVLAYGAAARLLVQENDDTPRGQTYASEFMDVVERMRMADRSVGSQSFVMGSRPRSRRRNYLSWGS